MIEAPLTQFFTFTIERDYDHPRERVFNAFKNIEEKAQWFVGPGSWKPVIREIDFRPGGHERLKGTFEDGEQHDFQAKFLDIRDNERIVYVYDMYVPENRHISVSLATLEFLPNGEGKTHMRFTEHAVYLDGWLTPEDREEGHVKLFDLLGAYLAGAKTPA
jgi:uncharacterized protein YndB with AHSA1/START domain